MLINRETGMYTMGQLEMLRKRIGHIEEDMITVKKEMIQLGEKDGQKAEAAWNDLIAASREISLKWRGSSAVEEIRKQREKN